MSARSLRRPAARLLRMNSARPMNGRSCDPAPRRFPAGPRLAPRHPADVAHDVNLDGLHAHLDDARRLDDLLGRQAGGREPERGKRLQQPAGVLGAWASERRRCHPCNGARRGTRVHRRRRQELNAVADQRAEELVEVRRQFHHAASAGTRRPRAAPPADGSASTRAQSRLVACSAAVMTRTVRCSRNSTPSVYPDTRAGRPPAPDRRHRRRPRGDPAPGFIPA